MNTRLIGSIEEMAQAIAKHDIIVIFHHLRPDGDCLGSQAGLMRLLKLNYPDKQIYAVGNAYDVYNFMDWQFSDLATIDTKKALAIAVDVSQVHRIEYGEYFNQTQFAALARIDHHEVFVDPLFTYSYVDPDAGACCEQIAAMAKSLNWKIDQTAARALYLGLMTDTNRYQYSGNRMQTQQLGAWLLETQFDSKYLYNELSKRTLESINFTSYILNNYQISGQVIYFQIDQKTLAKYKLTFAQANRYVNTLANINDYVVWASFIEDQQDWKMELRSNGPVITEIARSFGGGGHAYACGSPLSDFSKQKPQVLSKLNAAITAWKG